jgi:hypothetical protein
VRDAYLDAVSKVMIESVNTEEYARASGAMLDGYLTALAPVREVLDKAMVVALEQLSLPSRQQVVSLAERFTNLEMRFDDLDAKLDRLIALSSINKSPAAVPVAAHAEPVAHKPNGPAGAKKSQAKK